MSTEELTFNDGDAIFGEMEPSDCAFEVIKGEVELTVAGKKGRVDVAVVKPGARLSEGEALERSSRGAAAKAMGEVTLRVISRTELLKTAKKTNFGPDRTEKAPEKAPEKAMVPVAEPALLIDGQAEQLPLDDEEPAKPKKQKASFFQRLLGGRFKGEKMVVYIAPLITTHLNEPDQIDATAEAHHLMCSLVRQAGLKVKLYAKQVPFDAAEAAIFQATDVESWGRGILKKNSADLMIWGEIPPPATTVYLRFISAVPCEDDRPGTFNTSQALALPLGFGPEFTDLLVAVIFAATMPGTDGKALTRLNLIAKIIDKALPFVRALPPDLTSVERAHIRICFGNALATAGWLHKSSDLDHTAAQIYQEALSELTREEEPASWAMAQKHLGSVLQVLAERSEGADVLEASIDAFNAALKVLTRLDFPLEWASAQNRLGQSLYRLDRRTEDVEMTKHSLSAFQSALQVYSKTNKPDIWADVMNNFAQAAQVLGEQLRNTEVLEKAADACRQALSVRTKGKSPHGWAATQNNLGAALFLLAKQLLMEKKAAEEPLCQAADAFRKALDVYTGLNAENLARITGRNLSRVEGALDKLHGKPAPKLRWENEPAKP
ncbi:MAG TPA: cyclic nucleotide-binding domain-containing protein [Alphaproteobacteria bacterium]|nr:cyclic nucleotide-binding domain-containing protein [Alphaproteobacteria bacterium]